MQIKFGRFFNICIFCKIYFIELLGYFEFDIIIKFFVKVLFGWLFYIFFWFGINVILNLKNKC